MLRDWQCDARGDATGGVMEETGVSGYARSHENPVGKRA
jgi:hypothetical protein